MFFHKAHIATMRMLTTCWMQEGSSAGTHYKTMKGYLNHLEKLGSPVNEGIVVDMILGSLAKSYNDCVLCLTMDGWDGSMSELQKLLEADDINRTKPCKSNPGIMINGGSATKPNFKGKRNGSKMARASALQSGPSLPVARFQRDRRISTLP